jgi:hypothetical protein
MKANEYQISGNHYKAAYEHWDVVLNTGMGYLEGCTTKYVVRWRKKGGIQDLKKALHYLNKLEEWGHPPERKLSFEKVLAEVAEFNEVNFLPDLERAYVTALSAWQTVEELQAAREFLFLLMDEAEALDKGPVPLTEENHHAERAGPT